MSRWYRNQSDVVVAALGESAEMTGESSSRSNLDIPQVQKDLLVCFIENRCPVVLCCLPAAGRLPSNGKRMYPSILNVCGLAAVKPVILSVMYCLAM